jgi:hypothetical protein
MGVGGGYGGWRSHEAGTPGLIGKIIPSQEADKKGTDPSVVVFLDGTCPFQCSGLSIETLKENVGSFVLRPGLSLPWVTKRRSLHRVP